MTLIEWLIVFYIAATAFVFLFAMNYPKRFQDGEERREEDDYNRKSS